VGSGDEIRIKFEINLEPVGLDGLDFQRFAEMAVTNFKSYIIISGDGIGLGGCSEIVKTIDGLGTYHLLNNLTAWISELHLHRVRFRKQVQFVLNHKVEVKRISRAPNTALSINKTFDAILHRSAFHIE